MAKIEFFVPTQTGSIAVAKGRAFPTRWNVGWSTLVGLIGRQYAPASPLQGALEVNVRFCFERPKSAKRRPHPITRPDAENCWKGIGDALEGVFWRDDAQIVSLALRKEYATDGRPGVWVQVQSLD